MHHFTFYTVQFSVVYLFKSGFNDFFLSEKDMCLKCKLHIVEKVKTEVDEKILFLVTNSFCFKLTKLV